MCDARRWRFDPPTPELTSTLTNRLERRGSRQPSRPFHSLASCDLLRALQNNFAAGTPEHVSAVGDSQLPRPDQRVEGFYYGPCSPVLLAVVSSFGC